MRRTFADRGRRRLTAASHRISDRIALISAQCTLARGPVPAMARRAQSC